MTSKKLPPIPPYYPAPSEGWNYPRPGVPAGLPDPTTDFYRVPAETPTNRELAQMVLDAERDKAIKESRDRAVDVARAEMTAKAKRSSERAKMADQKFTHALSTGYVVEISAITDTNGGHWFPATETAKALGYVDGDQAVRDHCKYAQPMSLPSFRRETLGLHHRTLIIPEGDVNRLISRSQLPAAVEIQDWWFDEVIPTIRKTGGYGVQAPARSLLEEIIAEPRMAQAAIEAQAKAIETLRSENSGLSSQNAGLADHLYQVKDLNERFKHGLNTLVALMSEPDGICLRDAANQLGQPQHAFNLWLKDKGWIYKNERAQGKKSRWKPHAAAIAQGLLGDKDWIRSKSTNEVTLYNPEMGYIDPNDFYVFKEVEVTRAGMVKILQYTDFPNPNVYAIQLTRKKFGVV